MGTLEERRMEYAAAREDTEGIENKSPNAGIVQHFES